MILRLGLSLVKGYRSPSGGGGTPAELISHWIGESESGGSIANEVVGKPALITPSMNNSWFNSKNAWYSPTTGSNPAIATGTISADAGDYTFIMAYRTGNAYSATVNQRFLCAKSILDAEEFDLLALPKADSNTCFEWSVAGDPVANLGIAAYGSFNTEYIITIIFEEPDIRIYRNGVLQGTLSGVYSASTIKDLAFNQWYGGGTNACAGAAMAECQIFAGVTPNPQRISVENALATTYGIT